MKWILELLDTSWLQIVGYTLLHSVWQGFIVCAIVVLALRFTPGKLSTARYAIAALGLIAIVTLSIATFVYLDTTMEAVTITPNSRVESTAVNLIPDTAATMVSGYLGEGSVFIRSNLPVFLMLWIFGTSLFSLRILTGLAYVEKLKGNSTLIHNAWTERIQEIARSLNIDRVISLAESKTIQVPIVVGYVKPMILIPVGMCTSLSTEQLETIFLHEITHIRRKDYLINLLQLALEAIYFFNPFVWILSGVMKREREHCCDDAVVRLHGSAKAYAHALATLEEFRLSKVGLSLSLAEDKNQLLNRVKRLMEKSVKSYSGRERIIPALLLVIGLICASWISSQKGELPPNKRDEFVQADTIKKDKKERKGKEAHSDKADPIVSDSKDGDAEWDEHHDHDAELYAGPYTLPDFNIHIPPIPDVAFMMPPFPEVPLSLDSPGVKDWEEFSREFEENFKSKFGDFYEKHGEEIQQMLEDVRGKLNDKSGEDWGLQMEAFAQNQAEWARNSADLWKQQADLMSEERARAVERQMESVERIQKEFERSQDAFERSHEAFEKSMKAFEDSHRLLEEKLKEELLKDGYLGKDEALENIHWYNGKLEINGKKIKPEHEKKYKEIYDKYFRKPGGFE